MPKFFSNLLRNKASSGRKLDKQSKVDNADAKLLLSSQSIHSAEENCYSPPPSLPVGHFSSKKPFVGSSSPISSKRPEESSLYAAPDVSFKLNETLGRSKLRQQQRKAKQEPALPCIFSDIEFNDSEDANSRFVEETSLEFKTSFETEPWPTDTDFKSMESKSSAPKPQAIKHRQPSSTSTRCSTTTEGSCNQSNISSGASNFSSGQSYFSNTQSHISRGTMRSSKSRRSRSRNRGDCIHRTVSRTISQAAGSSFGDSHFDASEISHEAKSTGDILVELSADKAFAASFHDEEQSKSTLPQSNKNKQIFHPARGPALGPERSEKTPNTLGKFLQKNTPTTRARSTNKSIAAESTESSIFDGLESIPDESATADKQKMASINEDKEETPNQGAFSNLLHESYDDASSSSSSSAESSLPENHDPSDEYDMKYMDSMMEEEENELQINTTASSSEVFMAIAGVATDDSSHQHVVSFLNNPPGSPKSCEYSQGSPKCVSDVDSQSRGQSKESAENNCGTYPVTQRRSEEELTRELAWVQLSSS
eukprot:CAMPEP_0195296132 /NCGR_PEP_ID=MMETSP0707-20130614/18843_1 /TAXON_ID=33640 /ORGANISM="Asterionellopsis glacialis, Strain CCMP134" /LENGTH=538 /DNA_ID=CAMNT_0040357549 /DNA_START=17 /DNA_END=1633 /DNA_ORIENTATION=-